MGWNHLSIPKRQRLQWDEITYPFPNFNGRTVEVWESVSNLIAHFTGQVITYLCWDKRYSMVVKRPLASSWVHLAKNKLYFQCGDSHYKDKTAWSHRWIKEGFIPFVFTIRFGFIYSYQIWVTKYIPPNDDAVINTITTTTITIATTKTMVSLTKSTQRAQTSTKTAHYPIKYIKHSIDPCIIFDLSSKFRRNP